MLLHHLARIRVTWWGAVRAVADAITIYANDRHDRARFRVRRYRRAGRVL